MQGSASTVPSITEPANPTESEDSITLRIAYFEYLQLMLDHQRDNKEFYLH